MIDGIGYVAMPNGVDKNYRRLLMACAQYRSQYREWPSQVRMHPAMLHDLANLFDQENFERLAAHLEVRTRDRMAISVGGRGVFEYGRDGEPELDLSMLALAETWLGLEVRPDVRH